MYVVCICSLSGIHLTQYVRLVIGYPDRGPGRVGPVSRQFNPSFLRLAHCLTFMCEYARM